MHVRRMRCEEGFLRKKKKSFNLNNAFSLTVSCLKHQMHSCIIFVLSWHLYACCWLHINIALNFNEFVFFFCSLSWNSLNSGTSYFTPTKMQLIWVKLMWTNFNKNSNFNFEVSLRLSWARYELLKPAFINALLAPTTLRFAHFDSNPAHVPTFVHSINTIVIHIFISFLNRMQTDCCVVVVGTCTRRTVKCQVRVYCYVSRVRVHNIFFFFFKSLIGSFSGCYYFFIVFKAFNSYAHKFA